MELNGIADSFPMRRLEGCYLVHCCAGPDDDSLSGFVMIQGIHGQILHRPNRSLIIQRHFSIYSYRVCHSAPLYYKDVSVN